MKIKEIDPPRVFQVGVPQNNIFIKDCAKIYLNNDEQVTFCTDSGTEYDVARKSWGYYATPSLNGRLLRFGLKSALVKNNTEQYFLMLVEKDKEEEFKRYLQSENQKLICWLSDGELT